MYYLYITIILKMKPGWFHRYFRYSSQCITGIYYSSQQTATPTNFFAAFRVTFLMPRVCFKPITWCFEMHHVRTFSVWRHDFFVLRDVHSPYVYSIFKWKVYRAFCVYRKTLRTCPNHNLSSADKLRSFGQFYGRQKPL